MITECPCCGWSGYKTSPKDEDEAVLACPWCVTSVVGRPHLCARAQKIMDRREGGI